MGKKVSVAGTGGFIDHHLVRFLKKRGYWARGVDIKYPEYSRKNEAGNRKSLSKEVWLKPING